MDTIISTNDIRAMRQLLADYDATSEDDERDGIANELVLDLPALLAEVENLRTVIDSVLADADRSYYERRDDDWFLLRLARARRA